MIFNTSGELIGGAYKEYPSIIPKPDWIEQDANMWWLAVCETSKKVLGENKIDPNDISAIAVTNQRETIVPVNKGGDPLTHALVWQDRRTLNQCKQIAEKVGAEEIYSRTGLTIDPYFSAPKIMWYKQNKPEIFEKAHKFLLVHDFIVQKLTGTFITDYSNASRTMLFNINELHWDDELCRQLEVPINLLPTAQPSGAVIGSVTAESGAATGLKPGTTVVAGGGDQQCAALGLGAITEGLVKATTGTGTFVVAPMDRPKFDSKKRVLCSVSVLPDQWVLEASIFSTGSVYRWFRDNFGEHERKLAAQQGIDVYEVLNQQAVAAEPGASGLLLIPHFVGAGAPHWNPNAKGVLYGLSLGHTKQDVIRAIIEGVCFEIKQCLEVFSELDVSTNELRIAGGASRGVVWNQTLADILGVPAVKTKYEETTALGAAIIAGVGCGLYKDINDAVKNIVTISKIYQPEPDLKELYVDKYKKYKKLCNTLIEYQNLNK
jgi:xylulokinase/glycerol kinase